MEDSLVEGGVRDGCGAHFGEGVERVKVPGFQQEEPLADAFEKVGESRGRSVSLAVHH